MKMSRKALTTIAALSLATMIMQSPKTVLAAPPMPPQPASAGTTISPLSDDIRWVYYVAEDGKRYKRLYNYSNGDWIGEWIYVGG